MNTPVVMALIGGALIGTSASLLLYFNGRIAGISGIVGGLLQRAPAAEASWRLFFLLGLVTGGAAMFALRPDLLSLAGAPSLALTIAAGFLVGVGTRLGKGCTGGHGICGVSRVSPRSIIATMTFVGAGAATVALIALLRWAP